jgi:hypothetical protein
MQPFFPTGANLYVVLGVFVLLLIIFDLVLVRYFKLSSISWKRVDYIWLGFAALGLIAAAAQVRELVATDQIDMFQQRANAGLSRLRGSATLLGSDSGPVCRTFVRSQYSPPQEEFDRIQQEYNRVCGWFKQIGSAIPRELPIPPKLTTLPSGPDASINDLKNIIDSFYQQLEFYNQDVEAFSTVYNARKRSRLENLLVYLGPFLLAAALALRVTKVTGEIKLEQGKLRVE